MEHIIGSESLHRKKMMGIQRDLYDFHSDNIIGEVRKYVL